MVRIVHDHSGFCVATCRGPVGGRVADAQETSTNHWYFDGVMVADQALDLVGGQSCVCARSVAPASLAGAAHSLAR